MIRTATWSSAIRRPSSQRQSRDLLEKPVYLHRLRSLYGRRCSGLPVPGYHESFLCIRKERCYAVFDGSRGYCEDADGRRGHPCRWRRTAAQIRLALYRAIMRKSFGSSAPSIIYVIVPAWTDDRNKREQLLEKAYRSALRLAVKNDLRSIAFPLLSSGNTRFAQEEAFRIARSIITAVVRREGT